MQHVEYIVKTASEDQIATVTDGRSSGSMHFVGILANYSSKNTAGYEKQLLAFYYLKSEASQEAAEHVDVLEIVLQLSGTVKPRSAVAIGDNGSVYKALAWDFGSSFVHCHSYRFILAIKEKF